MVRRSALAIVIAGICLLSSAFAAAQQRAADGVTINDDGQPQ
jgi:hypothetical protein